MPHVDEDGSLRHAMDDGPTARIRVVVAELECGAGLAHVDHGSGHGPPLAIDHVQTQGFFGQGQDDLAGEVGAKGDLADRNGGRLQIEGLHPHRRHRQALEAIPTVLRRGGGVDHGGAMLGSVDDDHKGFGSEPAHW